MKKYIIGVDLDGTLLTSNKDITDRTLWVIEQAVKKYIKVCIVVFLFLKCLCGSGIAEQGHFLRTG